MIDALNMNLKTIVDTIFQMEEEMDLFNQQIDEVYYWELIRFNVVIQIEQKTGVYGLPHSRLECDSKFVGQYITISNAAKNFFCKNPFLASKSDILFLGSPRRKLMEDGLWWDIYCDPILDRLKRVYNCLLLENPIHNSHYSPAKTENLRYLDLCNFISVILKRIKLVRFSLNDENKLFLNKIERYISESLGPDIDIKKIVHLAILACKLRMVIYPYLIKRINPSLVILICSYGDESTIKACKNLNIPTVELQHGNISRYHTGYSYPGERSTKKTFPDYFFAFGDYWKELIDFPISKDKIYSVGYPFFEKETNKYKDELKKNQVIFISQGPIGERLSKFAVELKNRHDFNLDIVYKLHPGEYARWTKEYPWLADSGIRVIDDDTETLYKLLAQSKIIIGVYSTVVYEGLGMGLKVFIVDLPGVEYMDELITTKAALKVSNVDDFLQKLKQPSQDHQIQVNPYHFFKPNALENIGKALDEIMSKKGS